MMINLQKLSFRQLKQLNQHSRIITQICHSGSLTGSKFEDKKHFEGYIKNRRNLIKLVSLIGIGSSLSIWLKLNSTAEAQKALTEVSVETEDYGKFVSGLPLYKSSEVREHSTVEKRVWISFRHGVYDITDFIQEHPGGDKIMLGAGGSVEPFWALYAVHKNRHVLDLLEKYRIGNLSEEDVGADVKDMDDPYANEPRRHSVLKPSSKEPFNAEPALSLLVESLRTPK
ncbi:UNVERIFIED_CONTAM: hypothetical protein GTU68_049253 [Idotea baltica]|nr:hypothetical protein [Idotea baltica]